MMNRVLRIVGLLTLTMTVGCASLTEVQKGAAIGGVVGAVAGLGYEAAFEGPSAAEAAGIGALGGALVGALVGDHIHGINVDQAAQAEIDRLSKEKDALEEKLRAAERENTSLKQDITNLQSKIAELERQIAVLREELAKAKGTQLVLDTDVLFDSGQAVLTPTGRQALDAAARIIKEQHAGKRIEIQGHTDTDPIRYSNWKSNWELGAARALAVLHYLEDNHGIAGAQLWASTYSFHRPTSPTDKAKNRRVVIVLYDN